MTRKKLKETIDKYFSLYVRLRDADDEGFTECFTCRKRLFYKEAQAGHFMTRVKMSTRWDELNVQVQCYGCNIMKHGMQYEFGLRLDNEIESGLAEYLHAKSLKTKKFSLEELEELRVLYHSKAKEELSNRGLG